MAQQLTSITTSPLDNEPPRLPLTNFDREPSWLSLINFDSVSLRPPLINFDSVSPRLHLIDFDSEPLWPPLINFDSEPSWQSLTLYSRALFILGPVTFQSLHVQDDLENSLSGYESLAPNLKEDSPYVARVATETYTDIVKSWKLDDSDAKKLLDVEIHTWMQIKSGRWSRPLEKEQLMRISAIIGLHRALHSCFNKDLANRWVKRSNTGPIFSGRKPIDVMIEGGLAVMIETRRYMESAGY